MLNGDGGAGMDEKGGERIGREAARRIFAAVERLSRDCIGLV